MKNKIFLFVFLSMVFCPFLTCYALTIPENMFGGSTTITPSYMSISSRGTIELDTAGNSALIDDKTEYKNIFRRSAFSLDSSDSVSLLISSRASLVPDISRVGISSANSDENDVKWVNLDDYFGIVVDSYLFKSTGYFPDYAQIDFYDSDNISHTVAVNNNGSSFNVISSADFDTDFYKDNVTSVLNNDKNTEWNSSSNDFHIKAKQHGKTYSLLARAAKGNYFSDWYEPGFKIKTDGIYPVVKLLNDKPNEWLSLSSYTLQTSATDEGSGVDRFRYCTSGAQSSGDWLDGTANMDLTINKQGLTYIYTVAIDKAGNKTRVDSSIKLDNIKPSISVNSSNTNWTNTNVTLTASVSDSNPGSGVKNVVKPNGVSYAPGDSIFKTSTSHIVSSNGTYKFDVYDHAGNSSSSSVIVSNIDRINPTVSLSPNSKTWANENIPVTITVSDNASGVKSWRYAVSSNNGSSWGTWVNGSGTTGSVTISDEGNSKIKVEVTDNAGNVGSTTSGTYQIDKTYPSATLSPNSQTWINGNIPVVINVSDNASGVKSWRYAVSSNNGSSWGTWVNGSGTTGSVTISNEGNSKIKVEVTDEAGNVDVITSGTYRIDKTNPIVLINPNGKSWTDTYIVVDITVSDSLSGVESWKMAISSNNGVTWSDWVVGLKPTMATLISTEGSSKIKVEVTDNVGNVTTVTSESYQIDRTKPSATFSPSSQDWINRDIPVNINVSDNLSEIKSWRYAVSSDDGVNWGTWVSGSGTSGLTTISTEGNSKIKVEVTDTVGNVNTITSGTYQVDKTNPVVTINPYSKVWSNTNVSVNIDFNDILSGIKTSRYTLSSDNGSTWGTWINVTDNSCVVPITTVGINSIKVEAIDNAGNTYILISGDYPIDRTPPTMQFSPNGRPWGNTNVTVNMKPSDIGGSELKLWTYRLSSDEGLTWDEWNIVQPISGSDVTFSSTGRWIIEAKIYDKAGNMSLIKSNVYFIDKVSPTSNISVAPTTTSRNVFIRLDNIVDLDSGVKEVIVGNYDSDLSAVIYNISGKPNTSLGFELDKRNTAEENYGERFIYLTLKDNANNIQKYVLSTNLLPKSPTPPIITNPINDSLFLLNENIPLKWTYTDSTNDFSILSKRFEIIIKDKLSNNIKKYEVNALEREFDIYDLIEGYYDVSVRCYVSDTVYSESLPVILRVGKFKKSGNIKTISISPGTNIKYVAISTESDIPKETIITGNVYYKYNSDNIIDKNISIPFNITSDYKNNILKLPEKSAKIEIEYFLKNNSNDDDLSPILDSIIVFAK